MVNGTRVHVGLSEECTNYIYQLPRGFSAIMHASAWFVLSPEVLNREVPTDIQREVKSTVPLWGMIRGV